MNIGIIGTGYVGLVTGTCLAETGNNVYCMDIDEFKISKLKDGCITIYEPGLEKLFKKNLNDNRLSFSSNLQTVVKHSEIIFLALPTPPDEDGSADLKYVLGVSTQLGKLINCYKIIVNKSTVPVGTTDRVRAAIAENYKGEFDVVSNPEFLREGVAVDDFMRPDRVVVGTSSDRVKKIMSSLYAPYVRQGNPIIFMDERSSELTKYAANSFLATKISFMNEIAHLCTRLGANVDMVRLGIGTDNRIGRHFLFPGIGYGGSCFPKDVKALISSSSELNYDFKILKAVEEVNDFQKIYLVQKILLFFNNDVLGKKFAVWGLSFKPNTDDIRFAPSISIINSLTNLGANVSVYDPEAMENARMELDQNIIFSDNQYDALLGASALIIATEWNEFRAPDFNRISMILGNNKIIFDGRNLFDPKMIRQLGFHYESIGRP